jgi:hypothetical protein
MWLPFVGELTTGGTGKAVQEILSMIYELVNRSDWTKNPLLMGAAMREIYQRQDARSQPQQLV